MGLTSEVFILYSLRQCGLLTESSPFFLLLIVDHPDVILQTVLPYTSTMLLGGGGGGGRHLKELPRHPTGLYVSLHLGIPGLEQCLCPHWPASRLLTLVLSRALQITTASFGGLREHDKYKQLRLPRTDT